MKRHNNTRSSKCAKNGTFKENNILKSAVNFSIVWAGNLSLFHISFLITSVLMLSHCIFSAEETPKRGQGRPLTACDKSVQGSPMDVSNRKRAYHADLSLPTVAYLNLTTLNTRTTSIITGHQRLPLTSFLQEI